MYISISSYLEKPIEVDYREDSNVFLFKFGSIGNMSMMRDQMEHLYNEMGAALMHQHYATAEVVETEWEN
jgi:hypothetical protein